MYVHKGFLQFYFLVMSLLVWFQHNGGLMKRFGKHLVLLYFLRVFFFKGVVAGRSHAAPKARASGQEEQPHAQGAVAAKAQEGLEELSHTEGQEGLQ